jgi:hypothetical protein
LFTFHKFDKGNIGNNGLENQESPYSHDLVPGDFHLSGPLKMHLGGQKLLTDDELKGSIDNWLYIQDKTLYTADISNLPGQ